MTLIGSGTITRKLVGSATLGTLAPTTTGGIEIDLLEGGDSLSSFTGESPATVQITIRKDTEESWYVNNPILGDGELGYNTEAKQLFIGDGVTAYRDYTDANYIVHWDEFQSALNDIGALQSKTNDQDTFLSQLQLGLNDVVDTLSTQQSDLAQLGSDISTLQSDLSSNVSGLQGQIDTLSGGVMLKYTLSINSSDILANLDTAIDIITPTTGKILQLISASLYAEPISPSGRELTVSFSSGINQITYADDIATNYDSGIIKDSYTFAIDQPLQLIFSISGTPIGDANWKLTIFYMEV